AGPASGGPVRSIQRGDAALLVAQDDLEVAAPLRRGRVGAAWHLEVRLRAAYPLPHLAGGVSVEPAKVAPPADGPGQSRGQQREVWHGRAGREVRQIERTAVGEPGHRLAHEVVAGVGRQRPLLAQ